MACACLYLMQSKLIDLNYCKYSYFSFNLTVKGR